MKTSTRPFGLSAALRADLTVTSLAALLCCAASITSTTACSGFASPDEDRSQPPTDAAAKIPPVRPAPLEGTPVTPDLDESLGIFVAANAADGGRAGQRPGGEADGTRARPLSSIGAGIEAAKATGKRVYVCEGTYRESIVLVDGISMVGGLDCSVAMWAIGNARARIEAPSSPAIVASSIVTTTRIERFEIVAPDATSSAPSSIALVATSSGALTIARSRIVAGNAANGSDGIEPGATVVTGDIDGRGGMSSRDYCWWTSNPSCATIIEPENGGAGGLAKCNGAAGGQGGIGGSGGVWQSTLLPGALSPVWTPYATFTNQPGAPASGTVVNGEDGTSATSAGAITPRGFEPAHGKRGANGSVGRNGAGGSGFTPVTSPDGKKLWYGVHGSGGGAGGCGGGAGTEGEGGGASIAALVAYGAVTFVDSELVAKNGGAGGKGTFGSSPTAGGKGGPIIDGIAMTKGEDGTSGGLAGASGSGAGGPSITLVTFGEGALLERTKLLVGQPGSGVAALTQGIKTIAASPAGEAAEMVTR